MNTELENSQKTDESSWGGARKGAGRKVVHPDEQVSRKMRRKFNDYVTEEQIEAVMASAVADAMNGKPEMMKFVLEQVFGKATQRQEHTGVDGTALIFQIAENIAAKNDIVTQAKPDSSQS